MKKNKDLTEIDQLRVRTLNFYTAMVERLITNAKQEKTYGKAIDWLKKFEPDWIHEQGKDERLIDQVIAEACDKAVVKLYREAKEQEIPKK